LSYFHYRRIYKDGSLAVLTNKSGFLKDFFQSNAKEPIYSKPISLHQSLLYFWDECLSEELQALTKEKHSLYHGMTLINRHKEYYDCVAFAMPTSRSSPVSHYFNIFNELKKFSELFVQMGKPLINKMESQRIKLPAQRQDSNRKSLLLPPKSDQIPIGPDPGAYVTTYELLCMQLLREGKSYKQIGETLSMSPRTVETHLARSKRRTGLTFDELSLKSFKMNNPQNLLSK
jgi:hypothetical protein